jgi:pilus assembly protein CpaE
MIILASPESEYEDRLLGLDGPYDELVSRRWSGEWLGGNPMHVVAAITQGHPEVVIIGPGVYDDIALRWIEAFNRERPDVSVILVTDVSADLLMAAMRAGARDILALQAPDEEIIDVLERARGTVTRIRETLSQEQEEHGRIITVLSPKGGSGKTTVSTNLAYGLSKAMDGRVGLIDLDVQFGDVGHALQLEPEHTIGDAALTSGATLDLMTLKVFLTMHDSGLFVLCSPESLIQAEEVGAEHVKKVLTLMVELFPFIVIDTGAGINEHTLTAMEFSTDLLLVASADTPSVRALGREIEALDLIGMTNQDRHLVLNRVDSRTGLDPTDIQAMIGMEAVSEIPQARTIVHSTNQGVPLLADGGRDPASRALNELVDFFLPEEERGSKKRKDRR